MLVLVKKDVGVCLLFYCEQVSQCWCSALKQFKCELTDSTNCLLTVLPVALNDLSHSQGFSKFLFMSVESKSVQKSKLCQFHWLTPVKVFMGWFWMMTSWSLKIVPNGSFCCLRFARCGYVSNDLEQRPHLARLSSNKHILKDESTLPWICQHMLHMAQYACW